MAGADWTGSRRHVVLALSTTCPSCIRSVGLYRELSRRVAEGHDWDLIVVGEERDADIHRWLQAASIQPRSVFLIPDFTQIGAWATPILLLVDTQGVVTDISVGRLTGREESDLWSRLDEFDQSATLDDTYEAREIDEDDLAISLQQTPFQLLDFRPRVAFGRSHLRGALNIPLPELYDRASYDLDTRQLLVLDCRFADAAMCRALATALHEQQGFREVALVTRR